MGSRLRRELCDRSVVIQSCHCREIARVQLLRIRTRDERVGVRGIADNEHFHIAIGNFVERLALRRKNLRVG